MNRRISHGSGEQRLKLSESRQINCAAIASHKATDVDAGFIALRWTAFAAVL